MGIEAASSFTVNVACWTPPELLEPDPDPEELE